MHLPSITIGHVMAISDNETCILDWNLISFVEPLKLEAGLL